ncbi:phosphotransferase [Streptomyces indicus]|uniref:Predicted kinase, aminoglycoside phosphotransferase (APT) family n=1 Tax=Streptomyces indicus TaxID=417292 RepID=A0A1G9FJL4_9ACTN|nr:phosphotransferase [Streptomyces indicus]SDK88618.1 Predicted kinase, aminoglycoside phosphotransferase (APT) family [Streptomyces indicus]
MELLEVAEAFGLGEPLRTHALRGGSSSGAWRLDTQDGAWLVKVQPPAGDWWARSARRAYELESAAQASALPLPRPLLPPDPAIGFWHDAGPYYARVSAYVPGRTARLGDPGLAEWLGGTLAAVAALDLPADLADDESAPLHPPADWRAWAAEARGSEVADAAQELLPAVAEATGLVRAAEAGAPAARLGHRDTGLANILVHQGSFTLIDWDAAGPVIPWWDAVHTALRCAGGLDAPGTTDAAAVRQTLAAYRAAGGPVGAADETAFAGLLRSTLAFTAYTLWLALGHRGGDAEFRAQGARRFRASADSLHRALGSLPEWQT